MKRFILALFVVATLSSASLAGAVAFEGSKDTSTNLANPKPIQIFTGRIYGKVKSFSFGPGIEDLEGATVHCVGICLNISFLPFNMAFEQCANTNITDVNGSYSFEVTTPGLYLLYAEKEGYITSPIFGFAAVYKGLIGDPISKPIWPALFMIPV